MDKQLEIVKFSHFQRTWVNGSYGYTRPATYKTVVIDDKILFIKSVEDRFIKNVVNVVPDNSKVFFSGDVTFPRAKFKDSYPTCKIVRDETKADIIIYDKSKMRDSLGMLTTRSCRKLSDNTYISTEDAKTKEIKEYLASNGISIIGTKKINILSSYWGRQIQIENFSELLVTPTNAKYVDVNALNNSNGALMDDEAFEKIDSMLESRTNDMMNLATRMLTAYNYEENRFKISQLIYNHWDYVRSWVKKNVEIKALLNKYNKEFGMVKGRSYYSRISGDSRFWMTQLEYYKSQDELDIINQKLIESLSIDTSIVEFSVKRKDNINTEEMADASYILKLKSDFFDEDNSDDDK